MLKRKVDEYLLNWKQDPNRNPLIIYGARQVGKTTSIRNFGKTYKNYIEVNFISNPEYKDAFQTFDVNKIISRLSFINPEFVFEPHNTLILFDEIQEFMDATTSLKFFKLDGRYDVICTGSELGVNITPISSVAVGFKDEYIMYSLDFEEFLWAKGYTNEMVESLLSNMINHLPLDNAIYNKLFELYNDYIVLGGYPNIITKYLENGSNFSMILSFQKKLYKDYMDDISKYLKGIDIIKAQRIFTSITSQLSKDNHKFQFTKLGHGARFNDYYAVADWLKSAGVALIVNNCKLQLPLKGNEDFDNFRMYYSDTSLLIASLDEETQKEFRTKNNFYIYNGAIYESIIASELNKQGYDLYFYRSNDATIELDFLIRFKNEIIPIEVKAKNGRTFSLNKTIENNKLINKGIKLANANIGISKNIIIFPYFLTFLLKRYLAKIEEITN